ncbi:hypothetical protein HPB50_010379 [Hyalomma asiaticum]|uniref:Uncharacterized protein n=1 Tax=Hyalomma asiaticum TaxID=266040 RepID=A0ACB7S5T8_HYAAI|nr:hypothetical protein HPB50_010379 [Hyalomma asiaticum]
MENHPPGFSNGGRNLCFANAGLQAYMRPPGLLDALTQWKIEKKMPSTAVEREFLNAFVTLAGECLRRALGSGTQEKFLQCCRGVMPHLVEPRRQQDCAEFILILLNYLLEITNIKRYKEVESPAFLEGANLSGRLQSLSLEDMKMITEYCDAEWMKLRKSRDTPMHEMFYCQGVTLQQCGLLAESER